MNKLLHYLGGLLMLTVATSVSQAQGFVDDFEDGVATDGSPVTWSDYPEPYNRGTFSVVNGDLVITPATTGPISGTPGGVSYREKDVVADGRLFHDVDVTTRVRATASGPSVVGIGLLDTHYTSGLTGMSTNASLVFDGSRRYLSLNSEINQTFSQLADINTTISQFEDDVFLRFSIEGNKANFKVWSAEETEPSTPQVTRTLSSAFNNLQGRVVLFAGVTSAANPVAFRYVNVVPEPTSSLLLVGLLTGLSLARKQRYVLAADSF